MALGILLAAVKLEWGECFADPEEALEGVGVVHEYEPPHDMLVTLGSGEQFGVPAGESSGASPANKATNALDATCDRSRAGREPPGNGTSRAGRLSRP